MQQREYTLHFIETETHWEHTSRKPINRGARWDVHRGVKFVAENVATAHNIAIGFAQFFEPDFVPANWRQINRTHTTNHRDQSRYDEKGQKIYNRRVKICLIDLTEFETAWHAHQHDPTIRDPVLDIAEHLREAEARPAEPGYCSHCDNNQTKIQVYPYELMPFGYHGTNSAYVCLTCGNF